MVMWGLIWGAILGAMWPGDETAAHMIFGMIFGAIAGATLRRAVRSEIAAEAAKPRRIATSQSEPQAVRPAASQPAAQRTAPPPAQLAARLAAQATSAPAPTPAPQPPSALLDLPTRLLTALRDWFLGGNTIVRTGVVVLFIGLAFLARYAVEHSLVPIELRLAGIAAAGVALFATGWRLRGRGASHAGYALTLQGAGVAVMYLAVFAAFRLYQVLPALAAFALLIFICSLSAGIALLQKSQPMAFIAFAGGFAAPFLVSAGEGSHVALFSYYALLGVAIACIAWFQAWRALNLLGFAATLVFGALWGVLASRSEDFATTQPFVIGFFAIYFVAALLYALRHSLAPRQAVDAALVFGVPIATMGVQATLVRPFEYATAFSALVLGAFYLAAGWRMALRERGTPRVNRWLAESFAALGTGFVTLAVPLALDARWTSAVWAVEGAAVYWMARRQDRPLARAFGVLLQVFAAVSYIGGFGRVDANDWFFANPQFIGASLLAGSALAIAWWSRATSSDPGAAGSGRSPIALDLSTVLFWVGFLWWQFAIRIEIDRGWPPAGGLSTVDHAIRSQLHLANWVIAAFAAHHLALPARREPWAVAATPSWFTLHLMFISAAWGIANLDHVFQGLGWVVWPVALALHLLTLRRLDAGAPQSWWPWVHAGNVWLAILLFGNLLLHGVDAAGLWNTAWASVILLAAASAVLAALSMVHRLREQRPAWPLNRFERAYLWRAALPVAVLLALGTIAVGMTSDGNARPLPYVPVLNPTDLSLALAIGACALWCLRVRESGLALPAWMHGTMPVSILLLTAFLALNTVWLRVAHHWGGVAWRPGAMSGSFLVQAGYSILWSVLAVVLMVAGHARKERTPWLVGAGLLGLTVLKLFVIDLSNRDGTERIVVFIAVGLLMLVVGWFAPLPPQARGDAPRADDGGSQGAQEAHA